MNGRSLPLDRCVEYVPITLAIPGKAGGEWMDEFPGREFIMLSKRIIPCLDVDRGRVVKGVKFFDHVDAGDPVEQAIFYDQAHADELVFYDITASHENRGIMADVVRNVADNVFMPITVG